MTIKPSTKHPYKEAGRLLKAITDDLSFTRKKLIDQVNQHATINQPKVVRSTRAVDKWYDGTSRPDATCRNVVLSYLKVAAASNTSLVTRVQQLEYAWHKHNFAAASKNTQPDDLESKQHSTEEVFHLRHGQADTDAQLRAEHRNCLYDWNGCVADAIRLIGADDEHFPPERITLLRDGTPYQLPDELADNRSRIEALMMEQATRNNEALHNGDCIGLANWRFWRREDDDAELKHLELTLRTLKWFDYKLGGQRFGDDDQARFLRNSFSIRDYVDFDKLADERDIRASKLGSILTLYVSCSTSDGYLVFTKRTRSGVGSHRDLFISAVSENLHLANDGIRLKDPKFEKQSGDGLFRGAKRGIRQELSQLLEPEDIADLFLLGLDFHFQGYHPGLLFYLPLPQTREEVEQAVRQRPGGDFPERHHDVHFIHLDDFGGLRTALSHPNWFSAGKACVIRTLEFLESWDSTRGLSRADNAKALARRE